MQNCDNYDKWKIVSLLSSSLAMEQRISSLKLQLRAYKKEIQVLV